MLLRLQYDEVDAAPVPLDGRAGDDGLLRADAVQQPPWDAGHRRHEDVLRVADAGAVENVRDTLRVFLVLHRDWRGGIWQGWRHDLFPRRAGSVREPVYCFGTELAGKENHRGAGNELPGARRHDDGDQNRGAGKDAGA